MSSKSVLRDVLIALAAFGDGREEDDMKWFHAPKPEPKTEKANKDDIKRAELRKARRQQRNLCNANMSVPAALVKTIARLEREVRS